MATDLGGLSVLVVDDDPDIVTTVRVGFEACGAKVTTASDGNRALEMAQRVDPDLIVLDMMMPRKSGFLVLESLKAKGASPDRPRVIMITANEGRRHEAYAKHLGVDEYLNKPFSMDRLLEAVCRITGRQFEDPNA